MKRYDIYLFRHGQTTYNRDGIFTGQSESKLTKSGEMDAKKVAQELKNKKFEVAIHTKLSRSKETLKFVLKFHPECKFIIEDNRMIERSYGDFEGMSHAEFLKRIGNQEYNLRVHGDFIVDFNPKMRKKIEQFFSEEEYKAIHRGYNVAMPDGESFSDVEKRVRSFIKDLKKFVRKNKVNVAISAHGNSIRLFRKIMENAPKEKAIKWFIPYDKVFHYKI